MNLEELALIKSRLRTVFSHGAPIDTSALFAGRVEQLQDAKSAISSKGQHIVVFGERGVGKTSLARVLSKDAAHNGYKQPFSGTINCDTNDDFSTLWHKIFREFHITSVDRAVGFTEKVRNEIHDLSSILTDKVSPNDVRLAFNWYNRPAIVVIDELDRVKDKESITLLADTIKTLSDHALEVTIILVGVADSVDQLIAEHRSVERALVQIRMPRMSLGELSDILTKALAQLDMQIDTDAKRYISKLAQGLPFYVHLIGMHSVEAAIDRARRVVRIKDVEVAIAKAVNKAQQSIRQEYVRATRSPQRDNLYSSVLLSCALANTDSMGFFAPSDVREPMSRVLEKCVDIPAFARHLNEFCEAEHGSVLERVGIARKYRYRFTNPMLQPYVILKGIAENKLSDMRYVYEVLETRDLISQPELYI